MFLPLNTGKFVKFLFACRFFLCRHTFFRVICKCFAKHLNDVKKKLKANGRQFVYLVTCKQAGKNGIYVNKDVPFEHLQYFWAEKKR